MESVFKQLFLKYFSPNLYESRNGAVFVANAHGLLIFIHFVAEHRGKLVVTLKKMLKMTPVAQVVLYTVLPSDEVVADSMNYPIQLCLTNKVRN